MKDTKKILGRYIATFLFMGVIVGAITFFTEMTVMNDFVESYSSLKLMFVVLLFTLSTFLIHMIATARAFGKATLTEAKKVTLTKTIRVVFGVIALLVMFADYFAFTNLNKSYVNNYRNNNLEQLKALVIDESKTQEEVDLIQQNDEKQIHTLVYISLGTKEITNIVVYLGVAAYVEYKIMRIKEENETEEVKE